MSVRPRDLRDGDAVVAVAHEVQAADLVHRDRRQRLAAALRRGDPLPAHAQPRGGRPEAAVEVRVRSTVPTIASSVMICRPRRAGPCARARRRPPRRAGSARRRRARAAAGDRGPTGCAHAGHVRSRPRVGAGEGRCHAISGSGSKRRAPVASSASAASTRGASANTPSRPVILNAWRSPRCRNDHERAAAPLQPPVGADQHPRLEESMNVVSDQVDDHTRAPASIAPSCAA